MIIDCVFFNNLIFQMGDKRLTTKRKEKNIEKEKDIK